MIVNTDGDHQYPSSNIPAPTRPILEGTADIVVGGALVMIGFVTLLIGLVSDLTNFNRQLLETTLEKVRPMEATLRTRSSDAGSSGDDDLQE